MTKGNWDVISDKAFGSIDTAIGPFSIACFVGKFLGGLTPYTQLLSLWYS